MSGSMPRWCGSLLFLLVLTPPASAQRIPGATPIDWEREREEYRVEVLKAYNDVMMGWRNAWESGDAVRAASYYAENALLVVPDSAPIQGRRAILAYFRQALQSVVEIRTGLSDFVASDRLAYALSPVWYRERDLLSGVTRALTGTCVTVLVRDGRQWKIRSQIFRFQAVREGLQTGP